MTRLDDLTAQATARYAIKDYNSAVELYSRATELQAESNGEMSSENADLLYAYGRCLYHVAVSNSDVLGSKVAGEKRDDGGNIVAKRRRMNGTGAINGTGTPKEKSTEEMVAQIVEENEGVKPTKEEQTTEDKPYFQFTGDENFDESDDSDEPEGTEAEEGPDAEEDDFSNAYEVLDLARILLQRRLEELQEGEGKGKSLEHLGATRQIKERLADTHDLQAEISLEGERFPDAVVDLRAALALKQELFPRYSSILAEAHFKLSLALEFSSVTQQKDENGEVEAGKQAHVDEAMREEAAAEMEAAIASCKLRIEQEEAALNSTPIINGGFKMPKVTRESIDEVKEIVKDMEQRVGDYFRILPSGALISPQLVELREPPVSIGDPTGTGTIDGTNPLSGILGSILGESPEEQKTKLHEVSRDATDLTKLVKRKKYTQGEPHNMSMNEPPRTNGKRKVDIAEAVEDPGIAKRTKLEDKD